MTRNNSALYGVFFAAPIPRTDDPTASRPMWNLLTNRRRALRLARQTRGTCMVIPRGMDKGVWGSVRAWDAPTFRVTADLVVDYRKAVRRG